LDTTFHLTFWYILLLPLLGVGVSTLGTLLGLGGGFILLPALLLLFPEASSSTISGISLTVVLIIATSATISNFRARRIDVKTAVLLAVGSVPAGVAGAVAANTVSRSGFEVLFGVMVLLASVYVLWRSTRTVPFHTDAHDANREIHERKGPVHKFYVNWLLAAVIGPLGGFLSAFFGIGGGIIHVPAMTFILKMPPRVASATSLYVIIPTAAAGLLTRILTGEYVEGWRRAGILGLGALIGAQVGIYLSTRLNQRVIMAILAVAMALVGARQILVGI